MSLFESIETAIEEFRQGRPVVVVDDDNRENEGDLIFPAAAEPRFQHEVHQAVACTRFRTHALLRQG